ncbi:MAG: TenA family transcriptional regulator [Cyanobacteria bacterium QS_7_48_42]|jgi:thiaminase/transcriptional activator TenA|nr:MAG: TenA family transcriptional regulator [Cyanobacteria bacterium QH_10_48_56]PSO62370.1 MAG: TenA family transcriptional regulator [Cyanobacteria bacterium QH_7_48_89]PSO63296.1 MAG: TenA family transcriptional regulator [Cyanobacteria bacterium QH_2_48_84]PSO70028.1 MAG: TenA family transcriptional regulator [Cyanobacteria bacterium QS_1_48_34]PSO77782.1 MAG: TenA family transcriptional regulator [Cyanobacteria bacterium QH_3_48_40]PSO79443.1 MAG: TenA family transcriptional regulator [
MSISSDLWQSNQDLVQASLQHPFVQGIATGTLERRCFAFYVAQDAFFLEAFARAFSIAAAKAPDWEGFSNFHRLADSVLEELHLHESYAAEWGVNLQEVKPAPANRRYADFLLATAWGSDVGLAAVAMSPCMRLYAFLGQQLNQGGIPEHQYADWIRTYSSQDFEQFAQTLESLVERYGSATAQAQSTYRYALFCEKDFFSAAWEVDNTSG